MLKASAPLPICRNWKARLYPYSEYVGIEEQEDDDEPFEEKDGIG